MLRLGIMGGAFNPIHYGHLLAAEEALAQLNLHHIVFVPTGHPPHKKMTEFAPAEDRYAMTLLATASNPAFSVSRFEIDRKQISFTIDTLRHFHTLYPKRLAPTLILGYDAVRDFPTWRKPESVIELCDIAAVARPGQSDEHLKPILGSLSHKISLVRGRLLDISATDIRRRSAAGLSIRYILPPDVENYIHKHGLYKAIPH